MRLQIKIMITVSIMIIIIVVSFGMISYYNISSNIETQMAKSAMDYAKTIAAMDIVKTSLANPESYDVVNEEIESLRAQTRFQYVIVMDMEGIQYSYPYKSGIGKEYKNGGETNVLENGIAQSSADRNVLISAIRAFAPVYYEDEQVGAVLVGHLTDEVQQELKSSYLNIQIALVFSLMAGFVITFLLSKNIKKSTFGLEPKEIALLVSEKELILNSLDQGMMAIDINGKIISINDVAMKILTIEDGSIGKLLSEYSSIFSDYILQVITSEKNIQEEEIRLNRLTRVIAGTSLMKDPNDNIVGAVVSIVLFSHARESAEKITNYEGLIDSLRAQSHEFRNKLHTVSGLIQLEEYEDAIDYIDELTYKGKFIHDFITNSIRDNKVSGLLLAKYNNFIEHKINLEFSDDSYIKELPESIDSILFCSILGNILDNSKDAIIDLKNPSIFVRIQADQDSCYIEIKNNGPMIKKSEKDRIFDKYYTSKKDGNGMGLYILKNEIEDLNGSLEFVNDEGVTWYVKIPK